VHAGLLPATQGIFYDTMLSPPRQIKLAVLCNTGPFVWLDPGAQSESDMDFGLYVHLAKTAERGRFDILFLADGVGIKTRGLNLMQIERMGNPVSFEPLTLLAALAGVTERIGLVATASTSYNHPYHIARLFGSLDFLTKGRAGWNVITSGSDEEAYNFGHDQQLSNDSRYQRANEVVDAVFALWDSFEDDAFLRDKDARRYFDATKMHEIRHQGPFFKIRGPLNMPRPPQGRPIISQAGSSPAGNDLAARTADVMYAKYATHAGGRQFQASMRAATARHGRRPGDVSVLPGFFAVCGGTEAEAKRRFAEVQEFMDDASGMNLIRGLWGVDLSGLSPDEPLPDLPEIRRYTHGGEFNRMRDGRPITIRDAFRWLSSAYGHISVIGTPEQIADAMEAWFLEGGADGFNLFPHYLPGSLDDFVDHVVPLLQRRGLVRTEYAGATLRDNLGLERPAHPRARS
jgi:FMN-dependent oxidoreductase (nitrilotriacetate monooxygenase family)